MEKLTNEIIDDCEKNPDKVNWNHLSDYFELSESFIEKYKDKLDWSRIAWNQVLSESFIKKYEDKLDWMGISYSQTLSEPFIEKFKDKVVWAGISSEQELSETFIEKYKDKLDWESISRWQKLSEEFIEKYEDKLDWRGISSNQKLSEGFIEKHKDKLDWFWISITQELSEAFIEKYKNELPRTANKNNNSKSEIDWCSILFGQEIPDRFKKQENFESSDSNTNISKKVKSKITNDDEKFIAGVCKVNESKVILTGKAHYVPEYRKIIENVDKKTVVVLWSDNTVTTAHCSKEDIYDFDVGLSLCFSKKMFNNFHNFALYAKHKAEKNN